MIQFEDIHVKLGNKEILKGVNLSSHEGKVVGILGANGCGKSTLIKTIFSMVPKSKGNIIIDGKNVNEYTPKELANLIGYVGQDQGCPFDFSVADIVSMGIYARKDKVNSKKIVQEALEELGISEYSERNIQRLSGGEKKMVYIARAVAQGAEMFVLDEPTNHLDIKHQLFVMDYLKNSGKTTLIVNHDLRLASHYCDYLYMISDGVVYAQGTPLEVLTRENVSHVFGISGYSYEQDKDNIDFILFDNKNGETI